MEDSNYTNDDVEMVKTEKVQNKKKKAQKKKKNVVEDDEIDLGLEVEDLLEKEVIE